MSSPLGNSDLRITVDTLKRQVKELQRRRSPGRPAAPPRTLAELEDVDVTGVSDAEVLTYDGDLGLWVRGTVAPSTPDIPTWQDTGTINYSGTATVFEFAQEVTVQPMSVYVVTVTGKVLDNRQVKACDDPVIWIPATWQLSAWDFTADPDEDYDTGNMGSGVGFASCSVLVANDTEEAAGHYIIARLTPNAGPLAGFEDWDSAADVEITIRHEYFY